jgi:hypothetical protein
MTGASHLAERIAETLRQRATHDRMPSVALGAGLLIPDAEEASASEIVLAKRSPARRTGSLAR